MDLLSGEASGKGLNLAYIAEGDFPESIEGDVTRLRQILINLLGNSIKFTEQGEVVLIIRSRRLDPDPGDADEEEAEEDLSVEGALSDEELAKLPKAERRKIQRRQRKSLKKQLSASKIN